MKYFIYLLIFAFMGVHASSQTIATIKPVATIADLEVSHSGSNLKITWVSDIKDDVSYWEIQGSEDGQDFKAIGIVFGSDPKNVGTYTFKQTSKRIKPGYQFFRVAHIEPNNIALASNAVRFTK